MSARPRIEVEGFDAIVAKAVELVRTVPGASAFELKYDAADRVLGEDEEPRDDEAVEWRATAVLRRRYAKGAKPVTTSVYGAAIVEPGGNHGEGIVRAVVELLTKLGANVTLMFGRPE